MLSAGLGGLPVGAVAQQHGAAAAELAGELLPLAQRYVLASGRRQGLSGLEQVRVRDAAPTCCCVSWFGSLGSKWNCKWQLCCTAGRCAVPHRLLAFCDQALCRAAAKTLTAARVLSAPPLPISQVESLTAEQAAASMAAYSLSIPAAVPSREMALAEFVWRNGWFLSQQRTPAHAAWLARAGVEA